MQRLLRWVLVGLHALAVALLIIHFYSLMASGPEHDANIGAGMVGLLLLGLGFPWTMLLWLIEPDTYNHFSPAVRGLVNCGPAVVNVVIHALLPSVLKRRRARAHRVAL